RLDALEVEVEGVLDLRGVFQTTPGVRAGFERLRYRARLHSPDPQDRLRELIDVVEATTPVLASFRDPVTVESSTEILGS
ncbi:MAG: OsmC family protein, partial [Armatimonadota bacterium]